MSICNVISAPIESLVVDAQVRQTFDEASLDALAETIKAVDILQPILVRRDGERLLIVDGERRYRAALRAGRTSVPVVVEQADDAPGAVLQKQLIANVQREELRPMEKATGIRQLMETTGWSAGEAAAKLGMSSAGVSRLLALLTLPEAIARRIDTGEIPASAAYELTRIEDPARRAVLADEIAAGRLTRDGVKGAAKAARKKPCQISSGTVSRATAALGDGRCVSVLGRSLTLESVIELIEDLLSKARRARTQGLTLPTFLKVLRETKA